MAMSPNNKRRTATFIAEIEIYIYKLEPTVNQQMGQFLILFTSPQLPLAIQEMVQITAGAHRQAFGDPPHRPRRLRLQARSQSHLH